MPPELANAWINDSSASLGVWFSGQALEEQVLGVRNVVSALTRTPGPVVASVEVTNISIPGAERADDRATIEGATATYKLRLVPGTLDEDEISQTLMCLFELSLEGGQWRVTQETCNEGL